MSPQEKLDAAKRISTARRAKKMSQVTLAKSLGVTQSVVSDWERGALQSWRDYEVTLSRLLDKPRGWFRDQVIESDDIPVRDDVDLPALVAVPEYEVMLSAGPGRLPTSDQTRRTWPLPRFLIVDMLGLDPDRTAMQEVIGDSMSPTLATGDFVLIDLRDHRLGLPGVFAVWDGDAVVCKRLERIPGGDPPKVRLKSDNPLHNEYEVLEETVEVVGRIRFVTRRM